MVETKIAVKIRGLLWGTKVRVKLNTACVAGTNRYGMQVEQRQRWRYGVRLHVTGDRQWIQTM